MTYDEAKHAIFATGTRPDGYFGDRCECGFSFDPESGKTLVVTQWGYTVSFIPTAIDIKEALWLLKNHPMGRQYYTLH